MDTTNVGQPFIINMDIRRFNTPNEPLTVIDKFSMLFPECRVWEVGYVPHQNVFAFYITPLASDYVFLFPKQVNIAACNFKGGYFTALIPMEEFTDQEQKELDILTTSKLRDLSHRDMKYLLIESFQGDKKSENS